MGLCRGCAGLVASLIERNRSRDLLPGNRVDGPLDRGVESQSLFVWRHKTHGELHEQAGILVDVEERRHVDAAAVLMGEAEHLLCNQERASELAVRLLEEDLTWRISAPA